MFRASIRGCLAVLLLAFYVPVPGGSGSLADAGAGRASCCAPKACCTVDGVCSTGGGCAVSGHRGAGHPVQAVPIPLLKAGRCHPEAATVGSAPTLDPGVLAALGSRLDARPLRGARTRADAAPTSRSLSPQVPPPRA